MLLLLSMIMMLYLVSIFLIFKYFSSFLAGIENKELNNTTEAECTITAHPQLSGLEQEQRYMSQTNQMEKGMTLNVALGLNKNSYSRSNQMRSDKINRMKRRKRAVHLDKPKSCFIIIQVPVVESSTAASENNTQT